MGTPDILKMLQEVIETKLNKTVLSLCDVIHNLYIMTFQRYTKEQYFHHRQLKSIILNLMTKQTSARTSIESVTLQFLGNAKGELLFILEVKSLDRRSSPVPFPCMLPKAAKINEPISLLLSISLTTFLLCCSMHATLLHHE